MKKMVELVQVDKTFFPHTNRSHHALCEIDLTIYEGDFITVVGGNGAGKTTLLNAIAGSFSIDSGKILIDDKDRTHDKEYQRASDIGRVFQNPLQGTAPRMTVFENLALAYRRGKKRGLNFGNRIKERSLFLEKLTKMELGLESKLDTEIGVLSGGQRQAISLLMATILPPKLLLLDEHTAALDPKTQKKVMELTQNIVEENQLTTLMITHDLQDALAYGNKLLVMHRGKVHKIFSKEEKNELTTQNLYQILEDLDK